MVTALLCHKLAPVNTVMNQDAVTVFCDCQRFLQVESVRRIAIGIQRRPIHMDRAAGHQHIRRGRRGAVASASCGWSRRRRRGVAVANMAYNILHQGAGGGGIEADVQLAGGAGVGPGGELCATGRGAQSAVAVAALDHRAARERKGAARSEAEYIVRRTVCCAPRLDPLHT